MPGKRSGIEERKAHTITETLTMDRVLYTKDLVNFVVLEVEDSQAINLVDF